MASRSRCFPGAAFVTLALLAIGVSPSSGQVILDPLVVTAARMAQPRSEIPFVVAVIEGEELARTGAYTIDDTLRSVAGFSLFRRAGSHTANPTTQGVSLRGLGASGTSRSLVLLDGVPFNDPFGGWVYWSKLPRESLDRVELVRGGGSGLWGSGALSGVISFHSRIPVARSGGVAASVGDFGTAAVELTTAEPVGPGTLQLDARWAESDGWWVLPAGQRGAIDRPAGHRHLLGQLGWHQTTARGVRWSARLRHFEETRGNGTSYTGNDTEEDAVSLQIEGGSRAAFNWTATAYAQTQEFSQTFGRVTDDRSEEFPASHQYAVPSRAAGGAFVATWNHGAGASTTAGADTRWVTGETRELSGFGPNGFSRRRLAGGEQWISGVFARHEQPLPGNLRLSLAARGDHVRQDDGHRQESEAFTGAITRDDRFASDEGIEISPSLALLWTPQEAWRFRVAAYRAFRVPTLNELYRPFRVGNAITEANESLRAETLRGVELGADWRAGSFTFSATAFANRLSHAISNVTIAHGPGVIPGFGFVPDGGVARRRSNLERVDVHGLELRTGVKLPAGWQISAEYLLADNTVREASINPDLVGNSLAQVPRHTFILETLWTHPSGWESSLRFRRLGGQWEDDENSLRLAPASLLDLKLRWRIDESWTLFAMVENLLDEAVESGRSADGRIALGAPRFTHGGVRLAW